MDSACKNRTRCQRCYLEACPFGRNGDPGEDEYRTATDRCKLYEPAGGVIWNNGR